MPTDPKVHVLVNEPWHDIAHTLRYIAGQIESGAISARMATVVVMSTDGEVDVYGLGMETRDYVRTVGLLQLGTQRMSEIVLGG